MRKYLIYILLLLSFNTEAQYVKKILTLGNGWNTQGGVVVANRLVAFGQHIPTPLSNGTKPGAVIFLHGVDHKGPEGDTVTSAGIALVATKGIPSQIVSGELGTFTIPGDVSPAGDRKWAVFFPQLYSGFSTWPVAYPSEMISYIRNNLYTQIDTNRIIIVGYSLGGGGAIAAMGHYTTNMRTAAFFILAPGYTGATNYQNMADWGAPCVFYHCVNDALANVSYSDNMVRNLNSYGPIAPVQYLRFNDLPSTYGGATQHDRIWPVVFRLTPGTSYALTNTDPWIQTTMLTYALKFTNKRRYR
jgi:predicted peptidase